MKIQNRQSSILVTIFSLLLALTGWMLFAPTQLGGSVTYVIVNGNSMEPGFHLDDLLLVRTEPDYRVGDAVTYQNKEMGKFVFHRIVGTELDRFILKGDNNSWLDSYHPNQNEVVGKLWVHIPKLGKAIEWVRVPINLAVTMGLLGGVLMSGMITRPSQGGKEKNRPLRIFLGREEIPFYFAGFLTLIFLGLSIFSFTRPLTISSGGIPYQQEGHFFYSATGTPGVYDQELIRPGEPVFPKLTCFLNIGFTYNLLASQLQEASGSYQLYARVLDSQSGWQRTIPLNPQTTFSGNAFFSTATLDLCQAESLANLVEQETGLHPNIYTLEIVSDVELTGKIAGNQVSDTFTPSLVFEFDKTHFYLNVEDAQTDPLHSVKQGMAGSSVLQANTFSVLGLQPTVWSIRLISLLGFALSVTGLLLAGMNIYGLAQQSEISLIKLKYGAMLVDVYEQNLAPTSSVIDVTSMDNLAKLAERQGTMILHMILNFLHYYLVQNNGTTYRYVVSAGKKGIIDNNSGKIEFSDTATKINENKIPAMEPIPHKQLKHGKPVGGRNNERPKPIRNEALEPAISQYKNNFIDGSQSAPTEMIEYVIQTGAIEFAMTQPEKEY
jgi:signal peptidase I